MDDLFFFFILPMAAAAVVAVVEWRRYRDSSEHGERLVSVEHRLANLESVVNSFESPDLRPLEKQVDQIEFILNALGARLAKVEEE